MRDCQPPPAPFCPLYRSGRTMLSEAKMVEKLLSGASLAPMADQQHSNRSVLYMHGLQGRSRAMISELPTRTQHEWG